LPDFALFWLSYGHYLDTRKVLLGITFINHLSK